MRPGDVADRVDAEHDHEAEADAGDADDVRAGVSSNRPRITPQPAKTSANVPIASATHARSSATFILVTTSLQAPLDEEHVAPDALESGRSACGDRSPRSRRSGAGGRSRRSRERSRSRSSRLRLPPSRRSTPRGVLAADPVPAGVGGHVDVFTTPARHRRGGSEQGETATQPTTRPSSEATNRWSARCEESQLSQVGTSVSKVAFPVAIPSA